MYKRVFFVERVGHVADPDGVGEIGMFPVQLRTDLSMYQLMPKVVSHRLAGWLDPCLDAASLLRECRLADFHPIDPE